MKKYFDFEKSIENIDAKIAELNNIDTDKSKSKVEFYNSEKKKKL